MLSPDLFLQPCPEQQPGDKGGGARGWGGRGHSNCHMAGPSLSSGLWTCPSDRGIYITEVSRCAGNPGSEDGGLHPEAAASQQGDRFSDTQPFNVENWPSEG